MPSFSNADRKLILQVLGILGAYGLMLVGILQDRMSGPRILVMTCGVAVFAVVWVLHQIERRRIMNRSTASATVAPTTPVVFLLHYCLFFVASAVVLGTLVEGYVASLIASKASESAREFEKMLSETKAELSEQMVNANGALNTQVETIQQQLVGKDFDYRLGSIEQYFRGNRPSEETKLEAPTIEGLHFISHMAIVDLRFLELTSDPSAPTPSTLVKRTLISQMERDDATKDRVIFNFATSGDLIEAQSFSGRKDSDWWWRKVPHARKVWNEKLKEHQWLDAYQLEVDIGRHRLDEAFTIVNELSYWNAYKADRPEWTSLIAPAPCDDLKIIHIFSLKKPFLTTPTCSMYWYDDPDNPPELPEDAKNRPLPAPVEIKESNFVGLAWTIPHPVPGWAYKISWDW